MGLCHISELSSGYISSIDKVVKRWRRDESAGHRRRRARSSQAEPSSSPGRTGRRRRIGRSWSKRVPVDETETAGIEATTTIVHDAVVADQRGGGGGGGGRGGSGGGGGRGGSGGGGGRREGSGSGGSSSGGGGRYRD